MEAPLHHDADLVEIVHDGSVRHHPGMPTSNREQIEARAHDDSSQG